MINLETAQRIGYQQAFKATTIGIVIAYAMMAMITQELLWFFTFEYPKTLVFATAVLYIASCLFGNLFANSPIISDV